MKNIRKYRYEFNISETQLLAPEMVKKISLVTATIFASMSSGNDEQPKIFGYIPSYFAQSR